MAFFGNRGQEPPDFFKTYSVRTFLQLQILSHLALVIGYSLTHIVQSEFKPKKRRTAKNGGGGGESSAPKKPPSRPSTRGKGGAQKKKEAAIEDDANFDMEDDEGEEH